MSLVVALVAWAGWVYTHPPLVDAWSVRAAPLQRTVQFSARVATLSRVDVGSTVTGRVADVLVNEGDQVTAGMPLLRLERDEARAAWRQAQASEQQARARLQGLRGSGRVQVAAALAQAEANLKTVRAELARVQQQVAQGFVSEARRDEAERAVAVALAQREAAQAQVQANAEGGDDVRQAEAQWASAQAATAVALAKLEQTEVRAPTAARVLQRSVEPGQIVQPGRALLALALEGPTQLKAQVDERYLAQLQPGQAASVVADAYARERWTARVLSIAPSVDAQRGAVEVTLALDGAAPAFLREDMTLSVEVDTGRRERALVVPLAALRSTGDDDMARVLVLRDQRAEERQVKLGLRTLEAAEVLEGLGDGDVVLLDAQAQAGQRLRPRLLAATAGAGAERITMGSAGAALTSTFGR